MVTPCFARALERGASCVGVHFPLTLQEVTPISKTRNQLHQIRRDGIYPHFESADSVEALVRRCGATCPPCQRADSWGSAATSSAPSVWLARNLLVLRGAPLCSRRKERGAGAEEGVEQETPLTLSNTREKSMRRQCGKTLGGVLALVCLVSTLAIAEEMTCTASDGKGTCTTATGPEGTSLVVVGEGLKVGEQMDCVDRGTMIACHAVLTPPRP